MWSTIDAGIGFPFLWHSWQMWRSRFKMRAYYILLASVAALMPVLASLMCHPSLRWSSQ
jgi:hypothetical protein